MNLGRRDVACDHILLHFVHHDLKGLGRPAQHELNRLIDGFVFLLDALVVRQNFQRVAIVLGIGVLQLQSCLLYTSDAADE